jgi:WD40 repeat protein
MEQEQIITLVDDLVFTKTGQHLSDLQKQLLSVSWSDPRQRYEEIAFSCGYSVSYIKQDAGPKLWQLLSDICGEKVKKTNFRATLERQFQLLSTSKSQLPETNQDHDLISLKHDWGEAPDISIFYDRQVELTKLQQWITGDRCRLVTILGMGGMGKTHLSIKLGETIANHFEYIIWRSLSNAPYLHTILADILQFFTTEKDLATNVEDQISCLIDFCRKHRCLIILDNLETILASGTYAGSYQESYQNYRKLFQKIGECKHQSCFLLTSREKSQEIALMSGEQLPVRSLILEGLQPEAGLKLLQIKGCHWQSETEASLLVQQYTGNPLALKIVAATINELFEGDLGSFFQHQTLIVDQIINLLEEHFERLSELGKVILYWLAININPISTTELETDIFPKVSASEILITLKSLVSRCLIETQNNQFSLQPVIREYLLKKFIATIVKEITTEDLDLCNHYALLKTNIKEYTRKAQIKFIIQPITEKLLTIFKSSHKLEKQFKKILEKIQSRYPEEQGYAAGNLINLLSQMNTDLTEYNLSRLTIKQAYLQDIKLHQVNLDDSRLYQSVFAEKITNILTLSYSPDGQFLATGDASGEIRLWDVKNYQLLCICQGHAGWVHSVAFSPSNFFNKSGILASGSSDQTIKIWDINTGKCLKTLSGHNQRVRSVIFSPDGRFLASSSSDYSIRLWDINKGKCLKILSGHQGYVWSIVISSNGKILASGSEDHTVKIWDLETGNCLKTLQGHTLWIRSIALSPDDKILASGGGDRTIKIWDLETGNCLDTLQGHTQRIRSIAFSPDGKILASGAGDHTIRLWDYQQGICQKTLHGHNSRLGAIAFSPDSKTLASGGEDSAIKLWEVNTGECLKTWQGYASWVQSVAFSPIFSPISNQKDQKLILASGSEDKTIKLWEIASKSEDNFLKNQYLTTFTGHKGWVCSVIFSPDGKLLASASSDYTLKLWDVATGECLKTLFGHTRWIRSVAFSPDGKLLASASGDFTLKIWDVATGKCLKTLSGHQSWLWSVAFSPDGQFLASGSEDKTIKIWDPKTGECLATLTGHKSWVQSVIFSPDSQFLASGSCDHTVKLWQLDNQQCLKTFIGHKSWVQSVAFSPDGKFLASGSCDQTVKIWRLEDWKFCRTLIGHESWVWSVVFSPDGEILATGSQDESIKLWDIKTGQCLETLRTKRPYEGMSITETKGLTEAQKLTLKILGAFDND